MQETELINKLISNIKQIIVGKDNSIELIITALLAKGHVIIEDVPGVGKTRLVSTLASSCDGIYNRLQLTPDVMPGDITGFSLFNPKTAELEFRKGAAFCNFLLADEINRSSPKSQSALLEVMEEGQISVDGNTYILPKPFMVLATQNPVETYGTYHLPEAQMDRFIMKLSMGYPTSSQELEILQNDIHRESLKLDKVLSIDDINSLIAKANITTCSEAICQYIITIANATRTNDGILLGISPRGCLAMQRAAKAYALVKGRNYVLPEDIKHLAKYVFAHRIILTPKGKSMWSNTEGAISSILEETVIPVS